MYTFNSMPFISKEYFNPEPIKLTAYSGWIILYLFFIQGISGALLLLYYRPTIPQAYESIQQITNTLHYGWLIRGIHIWAIQLLIIFLLFHIIILFINQSYHSAHKITWILGGGMMTMIGVSGATGNLLPWTQSSYWTTTFITQMLTVIPVFGRHLKFLARGGNEISQLTLSRFFALHILIIPLLFLFFVGFHVFSIKKSLIPRDLFFHVLILLILSAALFSFSTFFPARIYPKADPFNTVINIKPAWYFLSSYETFQLFNVFRLSGPRMGTLLAFFFQFGFYLLFLLFPFFAPSILRNRRLKITVAISGALIFLTLTLLGYCR